MMRFRRWTVVAGVLPVVVAAALLSGCGSDQTQAPTQSFAPFSYDYLTKIRLNVASVTTDDSWTPSDNTGQHVEYLSPVQPIDALRSMARDRLEADGTTGQATFVIEDASIVQQADRLAGSFAVRLDVRTSDGQRSGYAEARVTRSVAGGDGQAIATPAAVYQLTKQMMDDMNVEFEYQVRKNLRDYVETSTEGGTGAEPVQSQDLGPPGASPGATPLPAPAAPASGVSPRPGVPTAVPPPLPTIPPPGPGAGVAAPDLAPDLPSFPVPAQPQGMSEPAPAAPGGPTPLTPPGFTP